jgi:hypothetical protein
VPAVPGASLTQDVILYADLKANFSTGLRVNSAIDKLLGIGNCEDSDIVCPPTIKSINKSALSD